MTVVHSVNIMILILLISVSIVIYYILRSIIFFQMTKKEKPREYAKDRMEYFREFHRVIAPVVVLKKDE